MVDRIQPQGLLRYKTQLINITLKSCDVEQLSKRDVTTEVQQAGNALISLQLISNGTVLNVFRTHTKCIYYT